MQPLTARLKLGKCRSRNGKMKVTQWQVGCCSRRTRVLPPEAVGAARSTPSHSWNDLIPCILSGRRETTPGLQTSLSAHAHLTRSLVRPCVHMGLSHQGKIVPVA